MKRSATYTSELREEAAKLLLTQGLTQEGAALRLAIPKGTLVSGKARHVVQSSSWQPLYTRT
ncbi:hypothetical protein [Janthinobacterium sp. HLX7-2]|uniref:hypothetical protein n=1 Tax=Janthinobacterium sp. HLX7-2 TaxID=1259331 RepID=UPI003F230DC3